MTIVIVLSFCTTRDDLLMSLLSALLASIWLLPHFVWVYQRDIYSASTR
jgi:hypothetical protein